MGENEWMSAVAAGMNIQPGAALLFALRLSGYPDFVVVMASQFIAIGFVSDFLLALAPQS